MAQRPDKDILLSLYENAATNINYFKDRTILVLSIFTGFSVYFLQLEKDQKTTEFQIAYVLISTSSLIMYWHYFFFDMQKHRARLERVKNGLKQIFYKFPVYDQNMDCSKLTKGDWITYVVGVFYMSSLTYIVMTSWPE